MTVFPTERSLFFRYLFHNVSCSLKPSQSIVAVNYSKTNDSAYFLLRSSHNVWLTLRLADHPLWLKNAQQLEFNFGNPANLGHLKSQLQKQLSKPKLNTFSFTKQELATLHFLMYLEQQGLVCVLHLPNKIENHKNSKIDIDKELKQNYFFIGNRNNLNHLLLPVTDHNFQKVISQLYGRNFLFSQFNGHDLLKLLPTNQWIKPVLADLQPENWKWQDVCKTNISDKVLLRQLKKAASLS